MSYSSRLDDATALAIRDFRSVTRKGKPTPYISHLFAVTSLVAEGGGDEDQLISAMLHDWLEDVPGATGAALEAKFGARVRRIVEGCTDATTHPKPPWRARKEAYLATVPTKADEVKLVCCADKLHNLQTLDRDLRHFGPATLDRFSGGRDGTIWYYRQITSALGQGWSHWLHDELAATLKDAAARAEASG